MIEEPITKFYVFQSRIEVEQVVVAIPINDVIFRCWSVMNEIEHIAEFSAQLLTDPNFGWLAHSARLGPLVAIYTIQSHPEYFL